MTAAGIDRAGTGRVGAGTGKVRYNHVDLQINRAERAGPDDLHYRRAALTRTGAALAKTWNPETVTWTYSGARFALPLRPILKNSVTLTEFFRVERVRPSTGSRNWRNIQRPSGCYGNGRNPYHSFQAVWTSVLPPCFALRTPDCSHARARRAKFCQTVRKRPPVSLRARNQVACREPQRSAGLHRPERLRRSRRLRLPVLHRAALLPCCAQGCP